jgi:hypothetical protein
MATRRTEQPASTSDKPRVFKGLPPQRAAEPAKASIAVVMALRALRDGRATEIQQKLALEWIVAEASGKRHFPYHQADRDTVFALGRLFVAEQIVGLFHVDLATLKEG